MKYVYLIQDDGSKTAVQFLMLNYTLSSDTLLFIISIFLIYGYF